MILRRVTAPASTPISLSEAKDHLRVTHSDEDGLIAGLIAAAVAQVDALGSLGRAMVTQTWAQYVPQSPGWVRLEMGPFIALVSVEYYDAAGVLQTADLSGFETWLQDDFVICKPKQGFDWPTADTRPDAIKITYSAGYGAGSDVPTNIRHALLLMVAHWYENRSATSEAALRDIPMGVDMMINAERVSWYG